MVYQNTLPVTWHIGQSVSFNSIPGANNNPNFGVRLVSEFESTATGAGADEYIAVNEGSNFGTGGTLWLDMVAIGGEVLDTSNNQPAISSINAQSTRQDTPTSPIDFTISDVETAAENLELSAVAGDPSLINSFQFSGSGEQRTVMLTPEPGAVGTTQITIRVTDAGGMFAETMFEFTVLPSNTPPVISSIGTQETTRNTPAAPIAFTISDADESAAELSVSAESSNPNLIAPSSLEVSGSGNDWTLVLSPEPGEIGVTTITLTVSDGALQTSTEFPGLRHA